MQLWRPSPFDLFDKAAPTFLLSHMATPLTFAKRLLLLFSCKAMAVCASCRIPAGGTAKAEFSVTPLDIGSGTALGATVTYKRQEGASEIQVGSCPILSVYEGRSHYPKRNVAAEAERLDRTQLADGGVAYINVPSKTALSILARRASCGCEAVALRKHWRRSIACSPS